MTKIVDRTFEKTGLPCFICDYSPPRSGILRNANQLSIGANFISIAHNPGQSVRASSSMAAFKMKSLINEEVIFTMAVRDKNHLALQSELLGAQLLGLENVVVVNGDPPKYELSTGSTTKDRLTTTKVISGITDLNNGIDYRRSALDQSCDFCIGAAVDLGHTFNHECNLAVRKINAGAHFLITQPVFNITKPLKLLDNIESQTQDRYKTPIFFGLQILEPSCISFSKVPSNLTEQLERGKSGIEIALELYREFKNAGLYNIYLVPPIQKGGTRNYQATKEVLAQLKAEPL